MPIWVLKRRVVNVIEQRNYSKSSVLKKVAGSKGRCLFEYPNVRIIAVIEQRNDSESSVLEKSFKIWIPEVRVGAHLLILRIYSVLNVWPYCDGDYVHWWDSKQKKYLQ